MRPVERTHPDSNRDLFVSSEATDRYSATLSCIFNCQGPAANKRIGSVTTSCYLHPRTVVEHWIRTNILYAKEVSLPNGTQVKLSTSGGNERSDQYKWSDYKSEVSRCFSSPDEVNYTARTRAIPACEEAHTCAWASRFEGGGSGIRTHGLLGMSQASYQTAPSRCMPLV